MHVEREEIDSAVLGGPVLAIRDFDPGVEFSAFEAAYVDEHAPVYVTCKVPAPDVAGVQSLEASGFRYLEFQLRLSGRVTEHDVSRYPYEFREASTTEDVEPVLELAASIFDHDRFVVDPELGRSLAGERYRRYVLKSYYDKAEKVYRLSDTRTGKVVGFSTNRQTGEREALLLIGGVSNEFKGTGLGVVNDYFALNELYRRGIRKFVTHMSGTNYPIMNLEIKGLGFRIIGSSVVLRKCYPRAAAPVATD